MTMPKEVVVWILEPDEGDELDDSEIRYVAVANVDDIPEFIDGKVVGVYKLSFEGVFTTSKSVTRAQ